MPTFESLRRERFSELKDIPTRGPEHNAGMSAYETSRAKGVANKSISKLTDTDTLGGLGKVKYRTTFNKDTMEIKKEIVT